MTPSPSNTRSARRSAATGLFPHTRESLAARLRIVAARRRIVAELNLLSDRALADIGIFRSDINEFAQNALSHRRAEPLPLAILADLRGWLKPGAARAYKPKAAE